MKWPRGKYNGRKIVGFAIKFRFHILYWKLSLHWNIGGYYFIIGPIHVQFEAVYDLSGDAK